MTKEIIPGYIGENIERSKQRRKLIDEMIQQLKEGRNAGPAMMRTWFDGIIIELEKLKEIS